MTKSAEFMGSHGVGRLLLRFAMPAVVATTANSLYNIVDRLYIGNGVGREAMAGLALTFPYMTVLVAFGMLVGVGSAAMVSLRLGEGRPRDAERVLGQAVSLYILLFLVLPATALLTLKQTLMLYGASASTVQYAYDYLSVILLGNIFQHMSFGLNPILQAEGNPRKAMITILLGATLNILLDPIFIFDLELKSGVHLGLGMGIRGAALATILSQAVSASWVLTHFITGRGVLRLRLRDIRPRADLLRPVLAIGLSPFLLQIVASVANIAFNKSFAHYGTDEQATNCIGSMAIIQSVLVLILMPIIGLNQGMQPLVGYNYGARKFDRVRRAWGLTMLAATGVCLTGWLAIQIGARMWVGLFTSHQDLIDTAARGLRIMAMVIPLVGFPFITVTYFQATKRPRVSILLSLLRQVLVLVPMILLLPMVFGVSGIWFSTPVSDLATAAIAGIIVFREMRRLRRMQAEQAAGRLAMEPL